MAGHRMAKVLVDDTIHDGEGGYFKAGSVIKVTDEQFETLEANDYVEPAAAPSGKDKPS